MKQAVQELNQQIADLIAENKALKDKLTASPVGKIDMSQYKDNPQGLVDEFKKALESAGIKVDSATHLEQAPLDVRADIVTRDVISLLQGIIEEFHIDKEGFDKLEADYVNPAWDLFTEGFTKLLSGDEGKEIDASPFLVCLVMLANRCMRGASYWFEGLGREVKDGES